MFRSHITPAPSEESSDTTAVAKVQCDGMASSNGAVPASGLEMGTTYVGIDNGVTGAVAAIDPQENWHFSAVSLVDCGKDRLLDVHGNLAFLKRVIGRAGGPQRVVVAYEKQKKNPLFGARGNFANGRNEEFWRVLLTLERIPFLGVDPNTWQKDVLKGIRGSDTKQMARLFVQQRYPGLNLETQSSRAKQEAIRDAMCVALWARSQRR